MGEARGRPGGGAYFGSATEVGDRFGPHGDSFEVSDSVFLEFEFTFEPMNSNTSLSQRGAAGLRTPAADHRPLPDLWKTDGEGGREGERAGRVEVENVDWGANQGTQDIGSGDLMF